MRNASATRQSQVSLLRFAIASDTFLNCIERS